MKWDILKESNLAKAMIFQILKNVIISMKIVNI